jgi:hypothetical protein
VINETEPLSGTDSTYTSIWYPTFIYNIDDMFISGEQYIMSADEESTSITFEISETPYYIKNVQSPIAKKAEVIFRTLLFSFLCLEICAMTFLICKLILTPTCKLIYKLCDQKCMSKVKPDASTDRPEN